MKLLRITLWAIVALILTAILIIGIRRDDLPFNCIAPFSIYYTYPQSDRYTIGDASLPASDIREIEIKWISGDLTISQFDASTVDFYESLNFDPSPDEAMRYYLNNGKLTIQFCQSGKSFSWLDNKHKSLNLFLPKDFDLDMLSVNTTSASLSASNISAASASFETVSGSIHVNNLSASERLSFNAVSGSIDALNCSAFRLSGESVSGKLEFSGSFSDVSLNSVSGSIRLAADHSIQRATFDSVSGSLSLIIPDIPGFTANHDSVSGSFTCDFPSTSSKNSVTYGNGEAHFEFDSVSGSQSIIRAD